jgi:IS4 transposase
MAWSNVPLETPAGEPFDVLGALRSLPDAQPGEFAVAFRAPDGTRISCRLVGVRKSEAAAELVRARILADARRHGNTITDIRTLEAAGYCFVLTNVSEETSAEQILALYRLRWQIEMKFKTLKSVLHLGTVPTRNGALLNVYLMAKLLVAMLIEDLVASAESFSPWGYPLTAHSSVAVDTTPA